MRIIKALCIGAASGLAAMFGLTCIVYGSLSLLSSSAMPHGAEWNHKLRTDTSWAALLGAMAGLAFYAWKSSDTKKSGWLAVSSGVLVSAVLLYQLLSSVLMRADIVRTYELLPEEAIQPWLLRTIFLSVAINLSLLFALTLSGLGIWLLTRKNR